MTPPAATFPLLPRRRIRGLAFGSVRSVRRGSGSDVASSREYRWGDDVSAIDWAASARLSVARGTEEFIVRERHADESPYAVVLADRQESLSIRASEWRPLDKPAAFLEVLRLVEASAQASRSPLGYLDYSGSEPFWEPPRSSRRGTQRPFDRPFDAAPGSASNGLEFLREHRKELPVQTFVFVVSDFLEPPSVREFRSAIESGWELVPVVIQDPVWERSFPPVGGIAVPYVHPGTGRVSRVYLTDREADGLRDEHEERWEALVRLFRSLDAEPVVVDGHSQAAVLESFLRWADIRRFVQASGR